MGLCCTKQIKTQPSRPNKRSSLPVLLQEQADTVHRKQKLDRKRATDVPILAIKQSKMYQKRKQSSENEMKVETEVT